MFEIKNLADLEAQLDAWEASVFELTRQVVRGLSYQIFMGVVERSAQYSGDFAANWRYSIESPDYTFVPNALGDTLPAAVVGDYGRLSGGESSLHERSGAAVSYARRNAQGKGDKFALGETIYITNSAVHDTPYAMLIEDNKIKFRQGNQGAPVARTFDELGRDVQVTQQVAQKLAKATL